MKKSTSGHKIDLITHPVRMRILMALQGAELTAQQIAALLTDVPASSIYRHVQKLVDAGLVEVVAERPVRGAVEKTLRVVTHGADLGPGEVQQMQLEDHRRALLGFFSQLYSEFDRYLQRPDADPAQDIVGYRAITVYATDEEWLAAIQAMNAALLPLLNQDKGEGRKRRRIASFTLPIFDDMEEQK